MKRFVIEIVTVVLVIGCLLTGCKKKKDAPVLSSKKSITSFVLRTEDNTGIITSNISGKIERDTISLYLKQGTAIDHLAPTISISCVSVSPESKEPQNFSSPVAYTVAAEDGSTQKYVAVVRYLSAKKEITSFVFKADNNAGIGEDLIGEIINDTITVRTSVPVGNLVPTITYEGKSISPEANTAQNFAKTVSYTVTAEDESFRTYHVFTSADKMVYVRGKDGLYALDAANGRVVWKYKTEYAVALAPTVNNGIVYIGTYHSFIALDAITGHEVWKVYDGAMNPSFPIVADGLIYGERLFNFTNYIVAYDAVTGKEKWQAEMYMMGLYPLAADGKVFMHSDGGYGLFAYDVNGNPLWRDLDLGFMRANPAYNKGVVYAGNERNMLVALDANNGNQLWTLPTPVSTTSVSPTISGDTLFFCLVGTLYEVSISTHKILLTQDYPGSYGLGNVVIDHGTLYAGTGSNYLYAIDAATGKEKWHVGTFTYGTAPINPVVTGSTIYAGNTDNYFYAYDAATSAEKWKVFLGTYVYDGSCVVDRKGNVYHCVLSGELN